MAQEKQNITGTGAQSAVRHKGGPAVLSLSGTWSGTTTTIEINLDEEGGSDNWTDVEDLDGPISWTDDKNIAIRHCPNCAFRVTTTGGTGIDLDFIVRTGQY